MVRLLHVLPLIALVASAAPSLASAREVADDVHADPMHHAMDLPDVQDATAALMGWTRDGDWLVSPVRTDLGSRAGAMLITEQAGTSVLLEARAGADWSPMGLGHAAAWFAAPDHAPDAELRVYFADFSESSQRTQLRLWAPAAQAHLGTAHGLLAMGWRVLTPVDEPGGNSPGAPAPPTSTESSAPRAVSAALLAIGVTPREVWGASSTNCSTPENNWYRFAIHHTAGGQTSGGTVQGSVQGLQNWAMGGGGFCDIPYQFLVGYDGSLWEGRNLSLYSGATGGGNNNGNIAISHLGCYHPSPGCSNSHTAELVMRAGGRLLAQTLAVEHGITTTSSILMGHRDYPGNSTACPGDFIHAVLDEYRSTTAHFEGTVTDVSWEGDVTVELGATESLWVEIQNIGLETWTANTRLAVLPRDVDSAYAATSWISATRLSSPAADTAPNQTAVFAVDVTGAALGTAELSFALVEEWVTWFPDSPIGGGPAEGELTLTLDVIEPSTGDDDDDDDDDDDGTDPADDDDATDEPTPEPELGEATLVRGERRSWFDRDGETGCGCGAKGGASLVAEGAANRGWLLLLGVALVRRRRA
ncbi:MAG: N-acetylmuramoyl-L-alanine amidase [Deltaproteobacteria bacterium]|nr:N-acetylmuramoyl-L-alanine amidase [Deltaproteobacteria bacterium]